MITYQIKKATTDVSVVIRIIDSTDGTPETGVVWNTAGIDMEYRREGAAVVDITEATLAALTTAHTDGGFLHISNGYYRLDLPDAACAAGANGVLVTGTVTGMVVIGCYIQLVDYDPFDTVRLGLTALPNAAADAAGGLPISDAGGLDLDTQIGTDIDAILVDTGTTLDAALAVVDANVDAILVDTGTTLDAALAVVDANVDAILVDTAEIGAAGVGLTEAGGTGDHLTAINLPNQTMDITGNITGNLSGSVGSVTGAVGSVTAEVSADVTKVSGDATAADTLELFCEILNQSTGQIDNGSMDTTLDTYQGKLTLTDDDTGTTDLYVMIWFKNGEPVTSGITSPTIQIIKASDGTDLVGSTAMTQIASLGMYKHAETTNRIADGDGYVAKMQATIGGSTRTWYQPVSRDD